MVRQDPRGKRRRLCDCDADAIFGCAEWSIATRIASIVVSAAAAAASRDDPSDAGGDEGPPSPAFLALSVIQGVANASHLVACLVLLGKAAFVCIHADFWWWLFFADNPCPAVFNPMILSPMILSGREARGFLNNFFSSFRFQWPGRPRDDWVGEEVASPSEAAPSVSSIPRAVGNALADACLSVRRASPGRWRGQSDVVRGGGDDGEEESDEEDVEMVPLLMNPLPSFVVNRVDVDASSRRARAAPSRAKNI